MFIEATCHSSSNVPRMTGAWCTNAITLNYIHCFHLTCSQSKWQAERIVAFHYPHVILCIEQVKYMIWGDCFSSTANPGYPYHRLPGKTITSIYKGSKSDLFKLKWTFTTAYYILLFCCTHYFLQHSKNNKRSNTEQSWMTYSSSTWRCNFRCRRGWG